MSDIQVSHSAGSIRTVLVACLRLHFGNRSAELSSSSSYRSIATSPKRPPRPNPQALPRAKKDELRLKIYLFPKQPRRCTRGTAPRRRATADTDAAPPLDVTTT